LSVRPEDYDEVVAKVNKKYENAIRRGNNYERIARIPSGSLELDLAMGGGIPMGRWTRFWGGYHSTKTLTALSVIREAQKLGMLCAYYNVEKQYDVDFARENIGLDVDALTLVEGTSVEEIGDKMEAMMSVCHLHVIDSCSIAVSEDELNADIRDWRPGITSRAWGKVFRRLNERFDPLGNTVVLIDQVRTNFTTQSEQAAGGRVFDHQSSMSVSFKKGKWIWRDEHGVLTDSEKAKRTKGLSGQVEPEGYEVRCRVEKSRACRPFRTATLRLDLATLQFDRTWEYKKAALHFGVIRQGGAYFTYTPSGGEEVKLGQGEAKVRAFIADSPEVQQEIRDTALRLTGR
jgi:recombination protein RecA